jgi:hypothetical protein
MARGRYIALLVSGALGGAACTSATTGKPLGAGDHVFVDVEASTLPPQPDADLDPDGTFARVDSSAIYGRRYGDAYAELTICARSDGGSSAADGAAGSGAYPADGGPATTGCVPFPASCAGAAEPDCVCLFRAFASQIPCAYPSCGVTKSGFGIYCPP